MAADLRTVAALGGHGQLAVTAVTAQDTGGVRAVAPVPPRLVRAQMTSVLEDAGTDAIKIGMLANAPIVRAVAAALARRGRARVVLDPVLRSTTGGTLLDDAGRRALVELLLPLADLMTPNLPEAEALLGHPIRGVAGMKAAARELLDLGPRAVLVKGGHRRGAAVDVFADAGETLMLSAPRTRGRRHPGDRVRAFHGLRLLSRSGLLLDGSGPSGQGVRHRRHPPFLPAGPRAGPREPDGRRSAGAREGAA